MIVMLWRGGLQVQEALTLSEHDLDPRRGSVLVRFGKGGRRREVGMDAWSWENLRPWLAERLELPAGPLFCVIDGPTRGRPWSATAVRGEFHRHATEADVHTGLASAIAMDDQQLLTRPAGSRSLPSSIGTACPLARSTTAGRPAQTSHHALHTLRYARVEHHVAVARVASNCPPPRHTDIDSRSLQQHIRFANRTRHPPRIELTRDPVRD